MSAAVLAVAVLVGGCGSDSADVGTNDPGQTTSTTVTLPGSQPDLVGTVTALTPFVPVTEDCVPADDQDPDGVSSTDDPPICTPDDNDVLGTVLVEERPDEVTGGRKISYTVTDDSVIAGVVGFDDLVAGQSARTWVAGDVCAESYPEQCGLLAIEVTG